MMNHHYICSGSCRGVSEKPGVCQAADCPRFGESLEACDCEDDQHHDAWHKTASENLDDDF